MSMRTRIIGCFFAVAIALVLCADARARTLTPAEAEARIEATMRAAVQPGRTAWRYDTKTDSWIRPTPYREYWVDQGIATLGLGMDLATTAYGFDRCPTATEGSPLFSWAERDIAKVAAGTIAVRGLFAWWERRQFKRGFQKRSRRAAVTEFGAHFLASAWNIKQVENCR